MQSAEIIIEHSQLVLNGNANTNTNTQPNNPTHRTNHYTQVILRVIVITWMKMSWHFAYVIQSLLHTRYIVHYWYSLDSFLSKWKMWCSHLCVYVMNVTDFNPTQVYKQLKHMILFKPMTISCKFIQLKCTCLHHIDNTSNIYNYIGKFLDTF